ncbi:MAG: BON domain-containing protein [Vicinamibacterales bacterium]
MLQYLLRCLTTPCVVVVLAISPADAQGADPDADHRIFKDAASRVTAYTQFTIFDDVRASVDAGVVTLTGKVTMPYKRKDIETRIARVDGVRQVVNRIDVLPVSTFDDELRHQIARAIYGNPSFWHYAAMANPPIHIVVDRGRVTLTGVVMSEVEKMLARSIATSFGAFSVKNELRTEAEAAAELEKMARR